MTHESTPAGTLRLRLLPQPSPPLPPQPAHPRAPPTCWPLPCFTARPDGYSVPGVAASGRGSRHTPEGSPPPDHCHGPHIPERPPHAGGFPASPPGQMATQGVAAATPPRAPRPQTTASTTAPWCSTTAASVLPSPAAPRGAPMGGAAPAPQGGAVHATSTTTTTTTLPHPATAGAPSAPHAVLPCYPLSVTLSPGRRSSPPDRRASPERGRSPPSRSPRYSPRHSHSRGLRSPCRSPSPLGEVYPYERRGWGCAAREWEALTTTITAPRQSREIGRARAMGTLPLPAIFDDDLRIMSEAEMFSMGFHKGENSESPPTPLAPPSPTPSTPSLWNSLCVCVCVCVCVN
ncbi:nascent polypeptide-associated complex subunit alpha, muscle-specific form-like isoform X1 [Scylla paramamosain]|uniref:nascent polypeptide-associated complex subunit alpha, muscle-specific form-like isoform X1 n=1 Tax=Scylla paramamosain TaxID=85552 RepID=UPI0030833FBB